MTVDAVRPYIDTYVHIHEYICTCVDLLVAAESGPPLSLSEALRRPKTPPSYAHTQIHILKLLLDLPPTLLHHTT